MKPIVKKAVQKELERFKNTVVYIHLETTNGAYASHRDGKALSAGAYIRNGKITFHEGSIQGDGPFRVGLQIDLGWVYAEGLTNWEVTESGQLLLAGLDDQGKLAVALQLSETPFSSSKGA